MDGVLMTTNGRTWTAEPEQENNPSPEFVVALVELLNTTADNLDADCKIHSHEPRRDVQLANLVIEDLGGKIVRSDPTIVSTSPPDPDIRY